MKTLRQQMDDAMVLRGFALRTRETYLGAVKGLAKYYRRAPDLLSSQDVQDYLLHMVVERKLAYSSVNQTASACRFLYEAVLRRPQHRQRQWVDWADRPLGIEHPTRWQRAGDGVIRTLLRRRRRGGARRAGADHGGDAQYGAVKGRARGHEEIWADTHTRTCTANR